MSYFLPGIIGRVPTGLGKTHELAGEGIPPAQVFVLYRGEVRLMIALVERHSDHWENVWWV